MNEKQGNPLDQRIRQILSNLPDAPPPGSSFDSARLWEQLRPELNAQPVIRKRVGGGWWWAAASVVGLVMGWGWWSGQPENELIASIKANSKPRPVASRINLGATDNRLRSSASTERTTFDQLAANEQKLSLSKEPDKNPDLFSANAQSESVTIGLPDLSPSSLKPGPDGPESLSLTSPVEIPKPTLSALPKRRFRVVHENELMAEDEAHRIWYAPEGRTERFVRLGTGSRTSSESGNSTGDDSPALQLPLNRKTTQ